MRQQLVEQILARADLAQEQVRLARSTPNPTLPFIQACVHNYVCRKFLLDPEEGQGLTMSQLANLSIERALDLKLPLAKESERATTCGAAGSSAMKIALLLVAVKKDFQVDIEPRRLGYVKDTAELGELVYQAMEEEKGA
ncbi:MAG: hypothetical protein LUB63_07750 [Oscillospiraceae bacterium]|nr:hypothetical protein [Oscillospiraceae bacterium]